MSHFVSLSGYERDDYFRAHYLDINAEKVALEQTSPKVRVAFVFAGTPRSFILPPIYESLRENLILSFCPKELCLSDVFARVSMSDNTHGGLDSVGKLHQIPMDVKPKVEYALSQLSSESSSLDVTWVDIGSKKEKDEMLASKFSSVRHKIFRTLDSRRYSMYFNRWSAYQMAVQREEKTGVKYQWVIHARLDSAWGEPVRPLYEWRSDLVYCPDTWWSDVPDTFAILSRRWSDKFYDLDSLVAPTAMCLGGPNFDPEVMREDVLIAAGWNSEEIKLTQELTCLNQHPGTDKGHAMHPKLGKIVWAGDGYSERILKRKLKVDGISQFHNTLVFHPFFYTVVRLPLDPMIGYLHPERLIGYVQGQQSVSFGQFLGCKTMFRDFNELHSSNYAQCSSNKHFAQSSEACVLDKDVSDWNFMPFRIRFKSLRTQLCWNVFPNRTIGFHECSKYHILDGHLNGINASYIPGELFSLFPLRKGPQTISFWGLSENKDTASNEECLTVHKTPLIAPSLVMSKCTPGNINQQFLVSTRPSSRFASSEIKAASSRKVLPVSLVTITWTSSGSIPVEYSITVFRSASGVKTLTLQDSASVQMTDKRRGNGPSSRQRTEFFLERSFSEGPSLSPLYYAASDIPNNLQQQQKQSLKKAGRQKTMAIN